MIFSNNFCYDFSNNILIRIIHDNLRFKLIGFFSIVSNTIFSGSKAEVSHSFFGTGYSHGALKVIVKAVLATSHRTGHRTVTFISDNHY